MSARHGAALFAVVTFGVSATLLLATPVRAQTGDSGDVNAGSECPSASSYYVYVAGIAYGANINGRANLYGKPCTAIESGKVAGAGICVAPNDCKAISCAGKACETPAGAKASGSGSPTNPTNPNPTAVTPQTPGSGSSGTSANANPNSVLFTKLPLGETGTFVPGTGSQNAAQGLSNIANQWNDAQLLNPTPTAQTAPPSSATQPSSEVPSATPAQTQQVTGGQQPLYNSSTFQGGQQTFGGGDTLQQTQSGACDTWYSWSCVSSTASNAWESAKSGAVALGDAIFGGPEGSGQQGLLQPTQLEARPSQTTVDQAAQGQPVTGIATEYNPFKPGESSGGSGLATGGTYNPNDYSAAIQTDIGRATGCGVGGGSVCYAQVVNNDNGNALIVKINDNGSLSGNGITGNRIIDLNQSSMDYLSGQTNSSEVTLKNVTVTMLPAGGDYTPGPINTAPPAQTLASDVSSSYAAGIADARFNQQSPVPEYNGTVQDWNAGFAAAPFTARPEYNGTIADWNAGFAQAPYVPTSEQNGNLADWTAGFEQAPYIPTSEQNGTVGDWTQGFAQAPYIPTSEQNGSVADWSSGFTTAPFTARPEQNGTMADWNSGYASAPFTARPENNGTPSDWNAGFAQAPYIPTSEQNGTPAEWSAGFAQAPYVPTSEQNGTQADWNAGFASAPYIPTSEQNGSAQDWNAGFAAVPPAQPGAANPFYSPDQTPQLSGGIVGGNQEEVLSQPAVKQEPSTQTVAPSFQPTVETGAEGLVINPTAPIAVDAKVADQYFTNNLNDATARAQAALQTLNDMNPNDPARFITTETGVIDTYAEAQANYNSLEAARVQLQGEYDAYKTDGTLTDATKVGIVNTQEQLQNGPGYLWSGLGAVKDFFNGQSNSAITNLSSPDINAQPPEVVEAEALRAGASSVLAGMFGNAQTGSELVSTPDASRVWECTTGCNTDRYIAAGTTVVNIATAAYGGWEVAVAKDVGTMAADAVTLTNAVRTGDVADAVAEIRAGTAVDTIGTEAVAPKPIEVAPTPPVEPPAPTIVETAPPPAPAAEVPAVKPSAPVEPAVTPVETPAPAVEPTVVKVPTPVEPVVTPTAPTVPASTNIPPQPIIDSSTWTGEGFQGLNIKAPWTEIPTAEIPVPAGNEAPTLIRPAAAQGELPLGEAAQLQPSDIAAAPKPTAVAPEPTPTPAPAPAAAPTEVAVAPKTEPTAPTAAPTPPTQEIVPLGEGAKSPASGFEIPKALTPEEEVAPIAAAPKTSVAPTDLPGIGAGAAEVPEGYGGALKIPQAETLPEANAATAFKPWNLTTSAAVIVLGTVGTGYEAYQWWNTPTTPQTTPTAQDNTSPANVPLPPPRTPAPQAPQPPAAPAAPAAPDNSASGGLSSNSVASLLSGFMAGLMRALSAPSPAAPASAPMPAPTTPSSISSQPILVPQPVVSLIANPTTVSSGGTANLAWSSVGTSQCILYAPGSVQIGQGSPDGSTLSPALATSTDFSVTCLTNASSTIYATTTVTVQ